MARIRSDRVNAQYYVYIPPAIIYMYCYINFNLFLHTYTVHVHVHGMYSLIVVYMHAYNYWAPDYSVIWFQFILYHWLNISDNPLCE